MQKLSAYILISLTLSIFSWNANGQEKAQETVSEIKLFPFKSDVNGDVGYINADGKIIIMIDSSLRYVNEKGELIDFGFLNEAHEFSDGLALVEILDGSGHFKYGFIDKTGKIAIQQKFDSAYSFSEGLAAVCPEFRKCGYIDKTGKFVIEPQYEWAEQFSEGLAVVKINGDYGYIDKTGKFVIEPKYFTALPFSEGLALVRSLNFTSSKRRNEEFGYIDRKGKLVINAQFASFSPEGSFSEGLAAVETKSAGAYINKSGKIVLATRFELVGDFSEGLAFVEIGDKYGYIDKSGRLVIGLRFNKAEAFKGNLARVEVYLRPDRHSIHPKKKRLREEYINKSGRVIFKGEWLYSMQTDGDELNETPRLVEVTIDSIPQGAKVYLVPLVDLDDDRNLLNEEKLSNYRQATDTPYQNSIYQQVYTVIVELNGARAVRSLDANPNKNNTVRVNFNEYKKQAKPVKRSNP
jgi:hypothetical protein